MDIGFRGLHARTALGIAVLSGLGWMAAGGRAWAVTGFAIDAHVFGSRAVGLEIRRPGPA